MITARDQAIVVNQETIAARYQTNKTLHGLLAARDQTMESNQEMIAAQDQTILKL
jgi:hypothetical protein